MWPPLKPRSSSASAYIGSLEARWSRVEKKVVMGDGSEWIWNQAKEHFPGATEIVDLYRAREHLWELVRKLHPNAEINQNRWMLLHQDLLEGKSKNWRPLSGL
jgi:hypothetical protein